MRRKHVRIGRELLRFDFTGKSGKQWNLKVQAQTDRRYGKALYKRIRAPQLAS
jgi:DNA topoisomerase IB